MQHSLLILRLGNLVLAAGLTALAVIWALRAKARRARTVFWALGVAGIALTMTIAQRLIAQLYTDGDLPSSFSWVLTRWWQLVVSGMTTVLLLGGVWLILRMTRHLEEAEEALSSLVSLLPREVSVGPNTFTARELEVLDVMAAGKRTDEDIASDLFISPSTAATHVRNIMRKSSLHNRQELMLLGRSLRDEATTPVQGD
jgi:DNA-binding CsgD family transcriptional regulator